MMRGVLLAVLTIAAVVAVYAQNQPTVWITSNGYDYATIDNVNPDSTTPSDQQNALPLPAGWQLAPTGSEVSGVGAANSWGTECLVLADGALTPTRLASSACTSFLTTTQGLVRPVTRRVFIRRIHREPSPPSGAIAGVQPTRIAVGGGALITITGTNLGSGSDITTVTLAGVPATIVSQSATEVVVAAGASTQPVASGEVVLLSSSQGEKRLSAAFAYVPQPALLSVSPAQGSVRGGFDVTVAGRDLLGGADIDRALLGTVEAAIVLQTTTEVVVRVPPAANPESVPAGLVDVTVRSAGAGVLTLPSAFRFLPLPPPEPVPEARIDSVTPASGSLAGGDTVTIAGANLDSTVAVQFGAVNGSLLATAGPRVTVRTPPASGAGAVRVTVYTRANGVAARDSAFTYTAGPEEPPPPPPSPNITSVVPPVGALTGGQTVTISGAALGNGSDIQAVLFGQAQAAIVSQSATQVVVTLPAGTAAGAVAVTVVSGSRGNVQRPDAFTYRQPDPPAERVLVSVQPAVGPVAGGALVTLRAAPIGSGNDVTAVRFGTGAAVLVSQTAEEVVVRSPAADGAGAVNVSVTSTSLGTAVRVNGYTYVPAPVINSVQPSSAALAGGARVTITGTNLGNGSDVVLVQLAGVTAQIVSQDGAQVVVTAAAASAATTGPVLISSTAHGNGTGGSFTYEAAPPPQPGTLPPESRLPSTCPNGQYNIRRLASDAPETTPQFLNPLVRNPWGSVLDPASNNLLVANAFTGVALFLQPNGDQAPGNSVIQFERATAGGGFTQNMRPNAMPTGVARNTGTGFPVLLADGSSAPAPFVFVSLEGGLHGYHPNVDPTSPRARLVRSVAGAAFTGCALAPYPPRGPDNVLFVADFRTGRVRVWAPDWTEVALATGADFVDPASPDTAGVFNVYPFNGRLYVAHALRDAVTGEKVRDAGTGYISVFSLSGAFLKRIADGGQLAAPWGMVVSPPGFGPLGGRMLVGNFGNGQITAFDHTVDSPAAGITLVQVGGGIFAANGMHALTFGGGANANTVYATAGLGNETRGMFVRLLPTPCPAN